MSNIRSMDLTRVLPAVLKDDAEMMAIARVVAEQLQLIESQAEEAIIYARIDALPEALLDILAYDMHVDWYDYEYTEDIKRAIIKSSVTVHREMGTKAAVETALGAIYPGAQVSEWFSYGGEPYHFKIMLDAEYEGVDPDRHRRILERVDFYKNLRSHLEQVEYTITPAGRASVYIGAAAVGVYLSITAEVKNYGMG